MGKVVELSAVAAYNWKLEKWLIGGLEFSESTLQITMDSNLEISAVFSDIPDVIADPAPPSQPAPTPTSPPLTQYALTS